MLPLFFILGSFQQIHCSYLNFTYLELGFYFSDCHVFECKHIKDIEELLVAIAKGITSYHSEQRS